MRPLAEVLRDWEAVIGLGVRAEHTTLETKVFCDCRLSHDDAPNTSVCPVCLGMPGALPAPNERAIESIVMAGIACDCEIMRRSYLYRKHYFCPDRSKSCQTTQGPVAFCMHGHLALEVTGSGAKETRHWEPSRRRTVVMRVKETADDYRMYPDFDLAPFDLSHEFVERCRARVPELPRAKRERYASTLHIKRSDAAQIAGDSATAALFEEAVALAPFASQTVANVVVNLLPSFEAVTPAQIAGIARLLADDAVTSAQARELIVAINGTLDDSKRVVVERGWRQSTNTGALGTTVDAMLARCAGQVRQYREGNRKVVGLLVGRRMKKSCGTGNPKLFNKLLVERVEG